ncbi:histidine kinase, partial [Burkholderia pseudomallei]
MKPIRTVSALISAVALVAACGGHDTGTELGISNPQARYNNAVPPGPSLLYYLNAHANATG